MDLISEISQKSFKSEEGNGNPLQYCLENPMDGGAWKATIHEIIESQTQVSDFTFGLP